MSEIPPTKKYPSATAEVSELLGFNNSKDHAGHTESKTGKVFPAISGNLPVVDSHAVSSVQEKNSSSKEVFKKVSHSSESHAIGNEHKTLEETEAAQPAWKKTLKLIIPYAAVFGVGLILYYFFLSNTDFSNIISKIKAPQKTVQTPKETALTVLEKENMAAYRAWIAQYYFDVSDQSIIDPNTDNSGNGLSNFQKFMFNLNPRAYDSLSLGMADSQALAAGINPGTGGPLTEKQKELVNKYFDMEVIMNRLALSNLNNSRNISNINNPINNQVNYNNYSPNVQIYISNDGKVNARGGMVAGASKVFVAPKTGADLNFVYASADGSIIDQTKPGFLEIPSLKIKAPVMWTQDPKNFDRELQSGVVHYPGTALPGQIGTSYISGHSSNYVWAKGSYNRVFEKLGSLADNSSFIITVYTTQGKTIKYHYVVTGRNEYKATDPAQFKNSGTSTVALSTCWPVNTTQKRLVVFGELTQTEK